MKLTLSRAQELLASTTDDSHLIVHATNVRGCMEAFARHFGQSQDEIEHWGADLVYWILDTFTFAHL